MRLQDFLQFSDHTPAELSRKLGCRQSTINQWKNGRFQPRADFIKRICEIFNVSADELLEIDIKQTEKLSRTLSKDLYRTVTKNGEYNSDVIHQMATTIRKARGGKVTEFEIWLRDMAEILYKIEIAQKQPKPQPEEPQQMRLL